MQAAGYRLFRHAGGRRSRQCWRGAAASVPASPPPVSRRGALCSLLACAASRPPSAAAEAAEDASEGEPELSYFTPPTRVTAPGRIVAIGDLHGDLAQARLASSCCCTR